MTTVYADDNGPMTLEAQLGSGGQHAGIFAVSESRSLAVKYFLQPPTDLVARLEDMAVADNVFKWAYNSSTGCRVAWPLDIVRSRPRGECLGYLMPRISGCKTLYSVAESDGATGTHQEFSWATLLNACYNLAATVADLHERDVVVGDLSPHNVLVSPKGLTILVDSDSMGFVGQSGRNWPSTHITEEFAAPERLVGEATVASESSDNFSLALLITQTLLCGFSPFASETADDLVENIRTGRSPLFSVPSPSGKARLGLLPDGVRAYAESVLCGGYRRTAAEWKACLADAERVLRRCDRQAWHAFCEPRIECPFCSPAVLEPGAPALVDRPPAELVSAVTAGRASLYPSAGESPRRSPRERPVNPSVGHRRSNGTRSALALTFGIANGVAFIIALVIATGIVRIGLVLAVTALTAVSLRQKDDVRLALYVGNGWLQTYGWLAAWQALVISLVIVALEAA